MYTYIYIGFMCEMRIHLCGCGEREGLVQESDELLQHRQRMEHMLKKQLAGFINHLFHY